MPLANIADGALALYVLKKLVTPWIQTDAFRLGLIDADGTLLRSPKEPEEKSAYTLLDRLVFNLKRILNKVPLVNRTLVNYAAALWLLKECLESETDGNLEELFWTAQSIDLTEEVKEIRRYLRANPSFELYQASLNEDGGAAGVAANNVGSGNIAGTQGDAGVKSVMAKLIRRKKPKG